MKKLAWYLPALVLPTMLAGWMAFAPAQAPVAGPPVVKQQDKQSPRYFKGRKPLPRDVSAWLHKVKFESHRHLHKALQAIAPPASWDSRTLGIIGPIKDQANCGSCWDFSGTFVCEVAFYKAGLFKPDGTQSLSEQYTLDCGRNGGCEGDDNVTVLQWCKDTGIPQTSSYGAYTARSGRCNNSGTLYKVDDWGYASSNGGQGVTADKDIQVAIMTYGAVGCAVAADNAFANWSGDQTTPFAGSGSQDIDHDVALVGWVTDAKGVIWIMRNSWGPSWGNQGYMYIRSGANLIGTESVWAVKAGPGPVPPAPIPSAAIMSLDFSARGYGPNQDMTFNTGAFTIPAVKINLVPVGNVPAGQPGLIAAPPAGCCGK